MVAQTACTGTDAERTGAEGTGAGIDVDKGSGGGKDPSMGTWTAGTRADSHHMEHAGAGMDERMVRGGRDLDGKAWMERTGWEMVGCRRDPQDTTVAQAERRPIDIICPLAMSGRLSGEV